MEKADWGVWCVQPKMWWDGPDKSPLRLSKEEAEKSAVTITKWVLTYLHVSREFEAREYAEEPTKH